MNTSGIYLVITIDTEADHSADWAKSQPLTFKSVTEAIPNSLQPLFRKYAAMGTYLLATEVLENDGALDVLNNLEGCELGTHLHPEYIHPEKKYFDYAGTRSEEFSNNYDGEVEREKINNITKLFEEKIGYRPRVYRGGKFGFADNTARVLSDCGYLVDTSVTPGVSWRRIGGPDFRKFADQPYFINGKDGMRGLLEVPVSITFLNGISRLLDRPAWLRPSFHSFSRIKKVIHRFIKIHNSCNPLVLNMMFHSMEFYPGVSPYAQDRQDCQRLLQRLEMVIEYCRQIGVKFRTLSQIRALYE